MESAKRTLIYYFRTVWKEAGLKWTSDNESEVGDILQAVLEEAEKSSSQEQIEVVLRQHGLIV